MTVFPTFSFARLDSGYPGLPAGYAALVGIMAELLLRDEALRDTADILDAGRGTLLMPTARGAEVKAIADRILHHGLQMIDAIRAVCQTESNVNLLQPHPALRFELLPTHILYTTSGAAPDVEQRLRYSGFHLSPNGNGEGRDGLVMYFDRSVTVDVVVTRLTRINTSLTL